MRILVFFLVFFLVAAVSGCGTDRPADDSRPSRTSDRATRPQPPASPQPPLRKARCPAAAANCRSASGRIVYVEAVDPDGDGDAHFVLASAESVTAPGVSVIDVERRLRPDPLPWVGDRISAAGPVYRGSYGQLQIQATELHVAAGRSRRPR